jgi:ABC-type branched-subunit amino acid transport system ATPase component
MSKVSNAGENAATATGSTFARRISRRTGVPVDQVGIDVAGDAVLDRLAQEQLEIERGASEAIGVGASTPVPSFGAGVRSSFLGWPPLLALSVFFAMDSAFGYVLGWVSPEISRSIGLSLSSVNLMVAGKSSAAIFLSLQLAYQFQRHLRRVTFSIIAAAQLGVAFVLASFASSFWGLQLALGIAGLSSGAIYAAHQPLLMDGFVPGVRLRALSAYRAGGALGIVVSAGVVGVIADAGNLTWRGILLVVGILFVFLSILGVFLKEPGRGRHDTDLVRGLVRKEEGLSGAVEGDETNLKFLEILRRLWYLPTIRRLLTAWAVLGIVLTPLPIDLSFYLEDRFALGVGGRGAFLAAVWVFALPALWWFGRRADSAFRRDPSEVVGMAAKALVVLAVGLLVGVLVPVLWVSLVGFGVAFAASAVLLPSLNVPMLSVVRPAMRSHAMALIAVFTVGIGGVGGSLVLGGIVNRFGSGVGIALLAVPTLITAAVVWAARRDVLDDVDRMVDEVIGREQIDIVTGRGLHLPMLACRHIDFSYGSVQVLFDVDFTIDDGEMLALLGTNGAGKSTLLRVIAGLSLPGRGTVQFRGSDITFIDAERRVPLGITPMFGGRGVFPGLSVIENMRMFGYTLGRQHASLDRGIERAFEAFPRLAERRNQPASTLSGGEQQMLSLSTAFITKPQLLLIDELSLGLAPKVVGELLEVVQAINAAGTAVVLVEQSVNIALALVEHAYFMEKGQMAFDGRAEDLIERPDLLRSVFLEGAKDGLDSSVT